MLLNSAVFPGQQGGPLEHVIAAKAVAFNENLWILYLHTLRTVNVLHGGYDIIKEIGAAQQPYHCTSTP